MKLKLRAVIKLIETDGWIIVRTHESHRQYKHLTKPGLVKVPWHLSDDVASGTLNSILEASGVEMRYLIILEPTDTGFSAYSPDVPGCISTGRTQEETEANMREAIELHLEGMREEGLELPKPATVAGFVDVAA